MLLDGWYIFTNFDDDINYTSNVDMCRLLESIEALRSPSGSTTTAFKQIPDGLPNFAQLGGALIGVTMMVSDHGAPENGRPRSGKRRVTSEGWG